MASLFLVLMAGFWPGVVKRPAPSFASEVRLIDAVQDVGIIRVGISDDSMTQLEYPTAEIGATGTYVLRDQATGKLLMQGKSTDKASIKVSAAGFLVRKNGTLVTKSPVAGPVVASPAPGQTRLKVLNITRRQVTPQFRGTFEIVRGFSSPAKLTVVNVVSLEDYLKAVVPNELPLRYGIEAVKAQAIAARNYAVRPREKPWKHFDICDSQYCQVYLGSQTETAETNKTIADTEGLVALSDGNPILALFSSSHGGVAEDYSFAFSDPISKQFPAPAIPYLSGGADIPVKNLDLTTEAGARQFWTQSMPSYDVDSPHYRWKKQWTRSELEQAINKGLLEVSKDTSTRDFVSPLLKEGDSIGMLKQIRVTRRGKSGKAVTVEITGSRGSWQVNKEFLIRKVLTHQGRMLPSANIVLTPSNDPSGQLLGLTAHGGGFGHGVGLSQLGASWMSRHGYPFPKIVQHYYKGVSLGSLPVMVGAGQRQPMMARFKVRQPQGVLWVQADEGAPVKLRINGELVQVQPQGMRTRIALKDVLHANQLNTMVLYADPIKPERPIKAWVDLYSPSLQD